MNARSFPMLLSAALLTLAPLGATAAEHPGMPASDTGAVKTKAFTAKQIKDAMRDHIKATEAAMNGVCTVHDDVLNKDWSVKFVKIHDPVRVIKEGKTAFACTDFVEIKGGKKTKNLLDVDFWLEPDAQGTLQVVATKIHKVNGRARFTYDDMKPVEMKGSAPAALCIPTAGGGVEHPGAPAK